MDGLLSPYNAIIIYRVNKDEDSPTLINRATSARMSFSPEKSALDW
jgi:hypothetical protein